MWCVVVVASTVLALAGAQMPGKPTPPPPDMSKMKSVAPEVDIQQPAEYQTDMPENLALLALNVDRGKYRNTRFYYQNHQELPAPIPRPDGLIFKHDCIEQFIQCLLSQSQPQVVCAYNNPAPHHNGFWTSESYCHVYFDNCRRRFRVWRLVDHGKCNFDSQQVDKDPGYKGNMNNHHGYFNNFEYEPPYGWTPAPVTDPDLKVQP